MLWFLFVGLVVGALAKFVMPGRDPGGIVVTMLLGVAGAILAGIVGNQVGWYRTGEPAGFFAALVGAVAILAIYRAFLGRKGTHLTQH